jgi:co-chaperonin GroES (HSP10)
MRFGDDDDDEPWKQATPRARHIPMQAKAGDLAIFLRKASVEIRYAGESYLIVPQSAILALLRDDDDDQHDADAT